MSGVLYVILSALIWLANAYIWLIIISAIMSWFVSPMNRLFRFLRSITEPVVYPFRKLTQRLMPAGMMFDISPMLAYIVLQIVISVLQRLLYSIPYY